MPKVLISDKMGPQAAEVFKQRGVTVDIKPGLDEDQLCEIISEYDGLAIRSSTKVTPKVLAAAKNLKVVGRAGIGTDNIDKKAATAKGVIVMNTPFGNSITTAEHAIAMMFALARQIPQANESTHAGKWEKSKFMGQEVTGKILGVIGCGNIGSIVVSRALGLQMKVMAYDPYLTEDRARELGVQKTSLDDIYAKADFITLHTPLLDSTRGMIDETALRKMKPTAGLINCARGGLIDEIALKKVLDEGYLMGAALDVFEVEPATDNILFGHEKVICTPHLGASTIEAQENVAIQVAEQISDYLMTGAVTNALNMPSVSAEDAPKLKPYMALAEQLGTLAGQIARSAVTNIEITYEGSVSQMNVKPLSALLLAGLLRNQVEDVNIVSAPIVAQERGIEIKESFVGKSDHFHTALRVKIKTENSEHSIDGTLFGLNDPRIVCIDSVPIETEITPNMLFIRNRDEPGLIGGLGSILGDAGLNIASFNLGRQKSGGKAIAVLSIDGEISKDVLKRIETLPQIERAQILSFA